MINCPLVTQECVALITAIFSDKKEIRVVQDLDGGDAQAFIDKIDRVTPHTILHWGNRLTDFYLTYFSLTRLWTSLILTHGFGRGVYTPYVRYVVSRPYFQSHCKSHSAMTDQVTHSTVVGMQMCGWVITKVSRLQ